MKKNIYIKKNQKKKTIINKTKQTYEQEMSNILCVVEMIFC